VTERKTPKHDESVRYKSFDLEPKSTALVIVDMENDWCKPGGHRYFPEIDPVIPRVKKLLETCRSNGTPVIYVHSVRFPDSDEFVIFGQEPFILKGTWGAEFTEELTPRPNESIVEKHTHDAFFQTMMDSTLQRLKILPHTHHVIVTGVAMNVCAYHAILGFHLRHYNVIAPMDCLAARPGVREFVERQFSGHAYNWNIHMTTLDKMKFRGEPIAKAA
jgi:nicotinamidase-related amidase